MIGSDRSHSFKNIFDVRIRPLLKALINSKHIEIVKKNHIYF